MSSRRVGRSSDAGTYHPQESDSGTVRSNAESRRSTRSSDSRFSTLRPRPSGADSELGSVESGYHEPGVGSHTPSVSTYGGRSRSSNPSARRYAGSTSTVRTLSEAGSRHTEHPASSGTRSSIPPSPRRFQPGLPSVAETLSQAGTGRDFDLPAMLDRLSLLTEAEREQDPAFSQVRSWVSRRLEEQTQSRASQPASTRASSTRAPSTHPSNVDPDDSSDGEDTLSHAELRELRERRRRRRRPHLAAQIDRSRQQ